jgi:hypothetical protein
MQKRKQEPRQLTVEIEIDGKVYKGRYQIEKDMIFVYFYGRKTAHIGVWEPRFLAERLLNELVGEYKKKG